MQLVNVLVICLASRTYNGLQLSCGGIARQRFKFGKPIMVRNKGEGRIKSIANCLEDHTPRGWSWMYNVHHGRQRLLGGDQVEDGAAHNIHGDPVDSLIHMSDRAAMFGP